jgi:hypothetical protein
MRLVFAIIALLVIASPAGARDDGRYANSPLKQWFDGLASKHGPCCSFSDGAVVEDPDWRSNDGGYQVRLEGAWIDVTPGAVITVPNLLGKTMVWPITLADGTRFIRCFMPGPMG